MLFDYENFNLFLNNLIVGISFGKSTNTVVKSAALDTKA